MSLPAYWTAPIDETTRIEKWLFETLSTDATLAALVGVKVYNENVPSDAEPPYVQFQRLSSVPVSEVSGVKIMLNAVYNVRAVGGGQESNSRYALGPIADSLQRILNRARGPVSGTPVKILACTLENGYADSEKDDAGALWQYLGGDWRILAQYNG